MSQYRDSSYDLGEGVLLHHTEKAILVELEGDEELWIPKSVVHDDSEVYHFEDDNGVEHMGEEGNVIVKYWWAENNNRVE